MTAFTKGYSSPFDLVQLLKSRGLVINDEQRAEAYIQNIGYYRLSAYMLPFLTMPKTNHIFKPGVTFDNVLDLYRFDKKLRVLLFNEIEKIEIAFREAVANVTARMSGDIFWMTDSRHFHLQPQALESWVTTLALTRNACCHHARVLNKVNLIIPADAKQMSSPWLTIPVAKDRINFNICMIKFFLDIISPSNDFKNKLHTLFSKFPLSFDSINSIKLWFFLRTGKFLYKIEKFMNL